MLGNNTLGLPGMDHASIATEAKVTQMLKEKGKDKKTIGREKFLQHAWEWQDKYGGKILNQLKKLGASCDWDRTTFTMDKNYSKAVLQAFVDLYNDGLIYQGERIINWDPDGLTALSNEEVIHKEVEGNLWYFKYPVKDSNEFVIVATTRPETMLGDTGIAVNPNDKRYQHLIGKTVILPIVEREIPIFSDEYVDLEFGTGCVKVTPAHDPNDFEMGLRNKLDTINIIHPNGQLNENCPDDFQNLKIKEARKKVVEKLKQLDLIEKIEDYVHNVGYSERTNVVVEPRLSKQWFLKMKKLTIPALNAVESKKIKFYPERWKKIYDHWLNNIKDWCISRQLWWGHRIPVWYKGDEIYCGIDAPKEEGWVQDEDVLDTWFSSWIWPLATLGWPNKSEDLKRFYPTQVLVTGPDIIFFWVARMIMSGLHFNNEIPFSDVYFTSIIRDKDGRKMSKSLGNSPDPLDLFDEYGVDAVRMSILMIAPQGTDVLFSQDRIEQGRNFMNKLWNCSRFLLINIDESKSYEAFSQLDKKMLDPIDLWILSRLNKTINDINSYLDNYKLNEAVKLMYSFIWKDYCDWYIEFAKSRIYGTNDLKRDTVIIVAKYILENILKLLHPYTPFITEEIWSYFNNDSNIVLVETKWPKSNISFIDDKIETDINFIMSIISAIRNLKSDLNISPKKEINLICRGKDSKTKIILENINYFKNLVKVNNIKCNQKINKPEKSSTIVINDVEIFVPLAELIDIDKEIFRLEDKLKNIESRMRSVEQKINNENFIKRAPEEIVSHEKKKYMDYKNDYNKLKDNLHNLVS